MVDEHEKVHVSRFTARRKKETIHLLNIMLDMVHCHLVSDHDWEFSLGKRPLDKSEAKCQLNEKLDQVSALMIEQPTDKYPLRSSTYVSITHNYMDDFQDWMDLVRKHAMWVLKYVHAAKPEDDNVEQLLCRANFLIRRLERTKERLRAPERMLVGDQTATPVPASGEAPIEVTPLPEEGELLETQEEMDIYLSTLRQKICAEVNFFKATKEQHCKKLADRIQEVENKISKSPHLVTAQQQSNPQINNRPLLTPAMYSQLEETIMSIFQVKVQEALISTTIELFLEQAASHHPVRRVLTQLDEVTAFLTALNSIAVSPTIAGVELHDECNADLLMDVESYLPL